MAVRTPIKWNSANFKWNVGSSFPNQSSTPFTWDDVALLIEVVEAVQLGGGPEEYLKDKKEKRKKLIKLICKVQGKTIKEEKEIKDFKITVKDIEILAEQVLGINVKVL